MGSLPYTDTPDETPGRSDSSWLRTAVGALLVLIGVEILLERLTGTELHLIFPALGLVLLAAWFRHDRFPFLVSGAILFGWGLGGFVESLLGPSFEFVSAAGLAWGFWLIPQLSGKSVAWARVPSLIVLTVALIQFAGTIGVGRALGSTFGAVAAPLAVITVGLLLVFRRRLTPQVFVVGVIVAAVLGTTAVGGAVADVDFGFGFGPRRTVAVDLPPLEGRTLVFEGGSGDVTITTGETLSVKESVRGNRDDYAGIVETDDEVIVRAQRGGGWWGGAAYTAVVPAGTDLRIQLGSGDVEAQIEGGDVDIETSHGEVDLTLRGDPDVDVSTRHGDIEAVGFEAEAVDTEDAWTYTGSDSDTVSIQTATGDVDLSRAPLR